MATRNPKNMPEILAIVGRHLRRNTPSFRVHYNYGFQRSYLTNNRGPFARLIEPTKSYGSILKRHGVESINSYEDTISNSSWLKHLRRYSCSDDNSHQMQSQPISGGPKSLQLTSNGSLGIQKLVFPDLVKLELDLSDPQDVMNLLQGCPNLETLIHLDNHGGQYLGNAVSSPQIRSVSKVEGYGFYTAHQ